MEEVIVKLLLVLEEMRDLNAQTLSILEQLHNLQEEQKPVSSRTEGD